MTESVTFPTEVGGDGSTYSDGNGVNGMAEGGHALYFFPLLQQYIAVAEYIVDAAADAADAAASAMNAPGTSATTTTSITIGTGSKTFTLVEEDKAFVKGQLIKVASDADVSKFISGPITAYNSGTGSMTINSQDTGSSGSFSDGIVSLSASAGVPATRTLTAGGIITGGGDLSANRTFTVSAATAAEIRQWADSTKVITPGNMNTACGEVTLQFGSNITTVGDAVLDGSKFINGLVFMSGDAILPNLTNPKIGQYRIRFVQDNVGNRKITAWGNSYVAVGGKASFVLTTAPGWSDYLYMDVITTGLVLCSFVKGPYN
jgi:hypothetical protein